MSIRSLSLNAVSAAALALTPEPAKGDPPLSGGMSLRPALGKAATRAPWARA